MTTPQQPDEATPTTSIEMMLTTAIAEVRGAAELAERVQTGLDAILREEQTAHAAMEQMVKAQVGDLRDDLQSLTATLDTWVATQADAIRAKEEEERQARSFWRTQVGDGMREVLKWGTLLIGAAAAAYYGAS